MIFMHSTRQHGILMLFKQDYSNDTRMTRKTSLQICLSSNRGNVWFNHFEWVGYLNFNSTGTNVINEWKIDFEFDFY